MRPSTSVRYSPGLIPLPSHVCHHGVERREVFAAVVVADKEKVPPTQCKRGEALPLNGCWRAGRARPSGGCSAAFTA